MLVIEARSRCLINILTFLLLSFCRMSFLALIPFSTSLQARTRVAPIKFVLLLLCSLRHHPLPLCANSTAKALPIPEFPPVITTTKPSNLAEHLHTPPAKYRLEKCSVNMIAKYYWLWELTINCKLLNLQRLYPLRIST
jgi:hypothetical protein